MFDLILDDVPLSLLGCCEITDQFLFWILLAFANRSVLWGIPTSVAFAVFHSETAVIF
jgi:drug/metabolite transporter superfamily protein YnfA